MNPFFLRSRFGLTLIASAGLCLGSVQSAPAPRPNILWIVTEDINPQLGCYGDTNALTPNVDRFATQGLRYRTCWSTAPVCAPARTALISGVYPTSTGSEHMRSLVPMPSFLRMYPQFLRDSGYYCINNSKEDYNLEQRGRVWDESSNRAHYNHRKPGQPFFAAFNINITHESQIRTRPHQLQHDPAKIRLPAYHPDTPEARTDWAQYYDNITTMDGIVARYLKELDAAGLADDTIVFFYGDNGGGMPRSKRWPYNSGLQVPLIIRVPEKFRALAPKDYRPGGVTDRLVGFVDFAPTLLSIAGIEPPQWMQGLAFMGQFPTPAPKYIYGFRGRMDERYDLVRSARDQRYIYIRNYLPHVIYGQYIDYMFQTPTTRVWKELYDAGKLQPPQTFFWEAKPPEELYDLESDPDEVHNLAGSSAHQQTLRAMRAAVHQQALQTRDAGFLTEAEQHRRSAGTTVYEMAHDSAKYPLERVLTMAEAASTLRPEGLPELQQGLQDPDPAVRYWAAMGLLMRGKGTVQSHAEKLRPALNDSNPSVRIAAATALGKFGDPEDSSRALAVLKELAPPDKNGAYVSLLALNGIDYLGQQAAPLLDFLKTMPLTDPHAVARANGYVARFVAHLTGDSRSAETPRKKKGQRKARPRSATE